MFNKFFIAGVRSDYEHVAKKITGMTDQLDMICDRAHQETAKVEEQIAELHKQAEEANEVWMKAQKLKTNLNKLFE